ncbi:endolytic transglycosylase MltG [Tessaracoccus sp. Z1128]
MSPALFDNDSQLDWRKIGYYARSAFAVLLSVAVLVGGGWFVYSKAQDAYIAWRTEDDFMGEGTDPVQVVIPSGATITQIGDLLTEAGVIKSTRTFRQVAQRSGESSQLQAGRFNLRKELPAETAFAMLLDPANQQRLMVTFPEGTTALEQVSIIAAKTGLAAADITAAAADTSVFPLPDFAGGKLEGFLFPSTYAVQEPPQAAAILTSQVRQFGLVAESISLEGRAAEMSVDPLSVVTIASIIASEVNVPADQPKVAAVIYNRLEQDMPLQMDSTVHYAVGKSGSVTTTAQDRATASPYNTYLNTGLPPGPISNPGQTALEAALSPADIGSLYFVTVDLDTGETRFADTLEEHNANVALFQAWCQANTGRC